MCGIAGFCNLSNKQFAVDPALLNAMHSSIEHRGPDGFGNYISPDKQVALTHRRLSIIDLSDNAAQPMRDKDNTVVVSYNGEIYNHQQLRAELEALGHVYFSNSDTETILYAYKQWGINFIQRLEGMFAIALFDIKNNELFLIRDRIGIKPLYFSTHNNMLSFASEIKALWHLPWVTKKLNSTALYHYLTFLVSPAPMTLYESVYKLPAAFYAKVDVHKKISFHEWYTPLVTLSDEQQKQYADEQFCIDTIRSLLRDSIEKRMMSDVPFGVFLSGGIDSSLNVALMSEFTDKVKTFNVSFSDGPEYSEVQWARKVAKHFGTEHHEIEISEKEAFSFFQKMVYHQDEPIGDCVCVPLYYVSKLLKDSGVTVVQVGEGSDELFCGYSTYTQYLNLQKYWQPTQKYIPAFAKQLAYNTLKKVYPRSFNKLDLVRNWSTGNASFASGAVVFSDVWKQEFVHDIAFKKDPIIEQIYPGFHAIEQSFDVANYHRKKLHVLDSNADQLKTMAYLELKHRLSELLLMRVDKMTMATSVEGRVPFLDHKLVEFALNIPMHLKYKNGQTKYILKKACEGILPHDVIYRKKMGFAAPAKRWFTQGVYFKEFFRDLVETKASTWGSFMDVQKIKQMSADTQNGIQDCSYQLWALQNVMACDVG